jgi:hypothetical protein
MKNNSLFIFIIFLSAFFEGCKVSKDQITNEDKTEIILVQNTPEILMINFSIDSRDSVKVINSLKNPGRLRGAFDSKSEPGEGDVIISFLNETNLVCSKTIVENPLIRRVEYSETDDISTLTAKTIDLDSAEFFIRVQYDDCFRHLKVEKYENEEIKLLKFLRNYNFPK